MSDTDEAPGLLGDGYRGHRALVARLLKRLQAICEGDREAPRAVLLTGPSGVGKSRIVREVYRALQAAQPQPGYWPVLSEITIQGHGKGVDPLPRRKQLGPPLEGFVWPEGALPSFAWWVFYCDRTDRGVLTDVISQARPAIEAHLTPVRLSWLQAANPLERIAANRAQVNARVRDRAPAKSRYGSLTCGDRLSDSR